jgi:4-diphosphocytidyl-2-C-methyl-D-erythritol kinase
MNHLLSSAARTLTVRAPAKLNLTLQIIGKRADNYHDLFTLFQSIDLCDRLQFCFTPAEQDELTILLIGSTMGDGFPLDDSNLIKKAAALFLQTAPKLRPYKVTVSVNKNIPIGAGLAGGSANAAATLLALNDQQGRPFTTDQLLELAAQVGSDVPFSLMGGTCLGQGRGEMLAKVAAPANLTFVLVKPRGLVVSTAWAYQAFDRSYQHETSQARSRESFEQDLIAQLNNKNLAGLAEMFGNSFEQVVFNHHPLLPKIKERLTDLGCLGTHLTGSGPTIYGLAKDSFHASQVLASIENDQIRASSSYWYKEHGIKADAWLVNSIDHGTKVVANDEEQQDRHNQ